VDVVIEQNGIVGVANHVVWRNRGGELVAGMKYILGEFPEGYKLYYRTRSGGSSHTDYYLYGHVSGLSFDSVPAFLKHVIWLEEGGQPIWKDGLCTSYLASRLPGARIDAVLKRTKVKIRPDDVKKSFVMVSCGTGIAPIRSLLYEYEELARTIPGGADV
jgi:hypothetical protein